MMKLNNPYIYIQKRYVSTFEDFKNMLEATRTANLKALDKFNVKPLENITERTEKALKMEEIKIETTDINIEDYDIIIRNIQETNIYINKFTSILDNMKKDNNKLEVIVENINIKTNNQIINQENNLNQEFLNRELLDEKNLNNINALDNDIPKTILNRLTDFIYNLPDMFNMPGKIIIYTIGAGIVIGGTYYLGNTIKQFIFRPNTCIGIQPVQIQPPINIIMPQTLVKETFFKQVGERIIKLLDILINKYQFKKYK